MILENKSNDKTLKITDNFKAKLEEAIKQYLEEEVELDEWATEDDFQFHYRGKDYRVVFTGIARGVYDEQTCYDHASGRDVGTGHYGRNVYSVEFQDVEICEYDKDEWFKVWE